MYNDGSDDVYEETVPDRSKSDYFCKICQSHMNSAQMWQSHIAGKRHQKNMKKQAGEVPSKVRNIKMEGQRAIIQDLLDEHDAPLLGLSFIAERQAAVVGAESIYHCHLCQGSCTRMNIIEHLETTKHRMAFFKQCDEKTHSLISSMKNLSKASIDALVDEHAALWEDHHGRELVQVELRKPVEWAPASRRNPLADTWSKMYRNSYSSHSSSSSYSHIPPIDVQLPAPGSLSSASSAAMDTSFEGVPLTMEEAKKNFEKFPPSEKLDLLFKLIKKMEWNSMEDIRNALRVYSALTKIHMIDTLRDMPPELQKRLYADLVVPRTTIESVLGEVLKGKKSYYALRKPFGEDY